MPGWLLTSRRALASLAAIVCIAAGPLAWGHGPDEAVALRLEFADGTRRSVRVTTVDGMGFVYEHGDGQKAQARWVELSPASLMAAYPKLHDGASAEAWLELGGWLSTMEGAERQASVAFQRARRLDAEAADEAAIEQARARAEARLAGATPSESDSEDDGSRGVGLGGPDLVSVDRSWPELTQAEHAEATEALREFAEPFVRRIAPGEWKTAETDYFLLYTDLDRDEALYWARLLDRMYDRMRNVFQVEEGVNVFKGRCLITIWSTRQRFAAWSQLAEQSSIASRPGIAGYCRGFPDGRTHVTFFRQPDRMEFALLMVHEASHAFTHRYRTGRYIPSWVNEGLAEYVAHNLIDAPRWAVSRQRSSREAYQANGGLATMFVAQPIDWFQYGQAWEFTEMMVAENVDGYRAFFNALKAGADIHTAFEDHYGAPLDRLVRHYANVYERSGPANYIEP